MILKLRFRLNSTYYHKTKFELSKFRAGKLAWGKKLRAQRKKLRAWGEGHGANPSGL